MHASYFGWRALIIRLPAVVFLEPAVPSPRLNPPPAFAGMAGAEVAPNPPPPSEGAAGVAGAAAEFIPKPNVAAGGAAG